MTPRELDPDVIQAKLRRMREILEQLETLGDDVAGKDLANDWKLRGATERALTVLVDLAVSINTHVATATLAKGPDDYTASFALAAEAGLISEDLASRLAPSAGLRNVLIHQYLDVDLDKVAAAVPLARTAYREYVRQTSQFLIGRE